MKKKRNEKQNINFRKSKTTNRRLSLLTISRENSLKQAGEKLPQNG